MINLYILEVPWLVQFSLDQESLLIFKRRLCWIILYKPNDHGPSNYNYQLSTEQSWITQGISYKVLKFLSPLISAPLSVIIHKSFSRGFIPDTMKIARVVPIKKSGEPTDMNNYRPISILPAINKIYEQILA